jgi:hypothetical protein
VAPIEVLGVRTCEPRDDLSERAIVPSDHPMAVIAIERPPEALGTGLACPPIKPREHVCGVFLIAEDPHSIDAANRDVMDGAGEIDPRPTGHVLNPTGPSGRVKSVSPARPER